MEQGTLPETVDGEDADQWRARRTSPGVWNSPVGVAQRQTIRKHSLRRRRFEREPTANARQCACLFVRFRRRVCGIADPIAMQREGQPSVHLACVLFGGIGKSQVYSRASTSSGRTSHSRNRRDASGLSTHAAGCDAAIISGVVGAILTSGWGMTRWDVSRKRRRRERVTSRRR